MKLTVTRKFSSRAKLKRWVKAARNIILLSVSLNSNANSVIGDANTVISNIKSTGTFYTYANYLPKGQYLVSFEETDGTDMNDFSGWRITGALIVPSMTLAHSQKTIDLKPKLEESLSDFEFRFIGTMFLINTPESPDEIANLMSILKRYSVNYYPYDGTNTMSFTNYRKGSGLQFC
ncbi:hypothetical protein [Vibrio sp. F74]|uniref:hypothetical protein n=1 Tax=Vibrio sp. F74 TaxID=700020 RepID=UPI0035F57170